MFPTFKREYQFRRGRMTIIASPMSLTIAADANGKEFRGLWCGKQVGDLHSLFARRPGLLYEAIDSPLPATVRIGPAALQVTFQFPVVQMSSNGKFAPLWSDIHQFTALVPARFDEEVALTIIRAKGWPS